jgi:hypothetical protein
MAVQHIRIATAVEKRYLVIGGVFYGGVGEGPVVMRNKVAKRFYHIKFMNR